jgi:bacteriocin biosynthesis cyclodehydratase domain-containing protein
LFLVRSGDADLVVRDASAADRVLLELLSVGEPSVEEVGAALDLAPEEVERKLADLSAAGVLTRVPTSPPLTHDDAQRFARQLPYLAEFGDEREAQRRLARAVVTVIGCGGLGTWALAALAAAGVRRFRLVDDDRVELSNLNRQVLYTPAEIGTPKVVAARGWLLAFDRRADVQAIGRRVDGPEAAEAVVAGSTAVVLVADTPAYELARWVNSAALRHRVPFVVAGQHPPLLKVGPFYRPGRGACFTCHERLLRRVSADYDAYVAHAREAAPRGATLGPASGMIGAQLAMEVVHHLIGAQPATARGALLLDLRTGATRLEPVERDPACPDCAAVS